jgi:hypothetical protein
LFPPRRCCPCTGSAKAIDHRPGRDCVSARTPPANPLRW